MRPSLIRFIALLVSAGGVACANSSSPIVVSGYYALSPGPTGCAAQTGTQQEEEGVLDSSRGTGYMVGVSLDNEMAANTTAYETQSNTAYLNQVSLKYRASGGLPAPAPESVALGGVLQPTGSLVLPVPVLTSANGKVIANKSGGLIVDMVFHGHFEDGTTWTTATTSFPIQVCTGCLAGMCTDSQATASCGPDASGQVDGRTCPATPGG